MIMFRSPTNTSVRYSASSAPSLQMNHIDGPLLCLRDGRMHWLTWRERFQLWRGKTNVEQLEEKYWLASEWQLMKGIK